MIPTKEGNWQASKHKQNIIQVYIIIVKVKCQFLSTGNDSIQDIFSSAYYSLLLSKKSYYFEWNDMIYTIVLGYPEDLNVMSTFQHSKQKEINFH